MIGDADGRAEGIADLLRSRGYDAEVLSTDRGLPQGLTDILHLAGLDASCSAQDMLKSAHALVLKAASEAPAARITFLASGAIEAACLEGFGRGVAAELPESLCRTITLDPGRSLDAQGSELVAAITRGRGDIRIRETGPRSPHLVASPAPVADAPVFDPEASYLVTGAYGGLGPHLVRWLHARGARRFVLAGRTPPGEEARRLLDGIDADFQVADVSDPEAVERLVARACSIAPLKGVFHAAGALAEGALVRQDAEGIVLPLGAKLDGALALDRATRDLPLDHFVLFSSAAGLLAPFGQANHAAAATALDALAHARRARGLPALCVDWGAFAEAGAAMRSGIEAKVSDTGLSFMGIEPAFEALGRAMGAGLTQVAILAADWRQYRRRYPRGGVPFLLEEVCRFEDEAEIASTSAAQAPSSGSQRRQTKSENRDWRGLLASSPESHRFDRLCDAIRAEAARILHLPAAELDDLKPLREAGLDSLMSIEFRNVLSEACASRLGATIVFDHPSVRALATHLADTAFDTLFAQKEEDAVSAADDLDGLDAEALAALLASELGDDGRV
ncbi:MAG TPA: beta-ketoacyl reductase [Saliniramus sp.]|nr:beta-ketoacyl reductase [Saliniramus sp.]